MRLALFAVLALIILPFSLFAADPIAQEKFEQLHTLIKPQTAEGKWQQIPWLLDLWEARKRAADSGKPILLWEMDGHPLGCV